MSAALGVDLSEFVTDQVARFTAGVASSSQAIAAINAVSAFMAAGFLLVLGRAVVRGERWIRFFAGAFFLLAAQYGVRTLGSVTDSWPYMPWIVDGAHVLGSAFNNVCWLAAARALLRNRLPIPWWSPLVAILTAIIGIAMPGDVFHRLPDVMFSAFCLLNVGVAMYRNFSPRQRPWLARGNIFAAAVYALLHGVFAVNPWLADGTLWPTLGSALTAAADARRLSLTPLAMLDAPFFAAVFFMRFVLFGGIILLIMKSLVLLAPRVAEAASVRSERGDFPKRVVGAMRQNVDADTCALWMILPGSFEPLDEPRGLAAPPNGLSAPPPSGARQSVRRLIGWEATGAGEGNIGPCFKDLTRSDPAVLVALESGGRVVTYDGEDEDSATPQYFYHLAPKGEAVMAIPLMHHGAVIGCLHLTWKDAHALTATAAQRVYQNADQLAPVAQLHRHLAGLTEINDRLHGLDLRSDAEPPLQSMVEIVHDVLAPLTTSVVAEIGFRRHEAHASAERDNQPASGAGNDGGAASETIEEIVEPMCAETLTLGSLCASVQAGRDPKSRPTLASDPHLRRSVAGVLADSFLQAVDHQLWDAISRLQRDLMSATYRAIHGWRDVLETRLTPLGLYWMAVEENAERQDAAGFAAVVDAARRGAVPVATGRITLFRFPDADGTPRCLLRLEIPSGQGRRLWLEVERAAFGDELRVPSPWARFLEELVEIVDSAWVRADRQHLLSQAVRFERDVAKMETMKDLTHQVKAEVMTVSYKAELLKMELRDSPAHERAVHLAAIVGVLEAHVRQLDEGMPRVHDAKAIIDEAARQVASFFESVSMGARAKIDLDLMADVRVPVPAELAYQALSTLVHNSVEAFNGRSGTVIIRTRVEDACVTCEVSDDGPGIDAAVVERLFTGTSTKGRHRGDGLASLWRRLRQHNCQIELVSRSHPATRFRIRFPVA